MKTKMSDLNMHLFAQLERLGNEELKADELEMEVDRSRAIIGISSEIIKATKITVDAYRMIANGSFQKGQLPAVFLSPDEMKLIAK